MKYYLSLGSNMGDRKSNLSDAVSFLKRTGRISKISSIYKTSPVKMPVYTEYFLNLVLDLETEYTPEKLLKVVKDFERKRGRKRRSRNYEARIIDIDILFANNIIIKKTRLVIPHPEMINRAFVLIPLSEIAPDLVHPILNKTITDILTDLKTYDEVIKIKDKLAV